MLQIQKQQKQMKSVTKKPKHFDKPPLYKHQSFNPNPNLRTEQSLSQEQLRRYSEIPPQQAPPNIKRQSRQSRVTNVKSQHPARKRSQTPTTSKAGSLYMVECESRYNELQQIIRRQNENYRQQNEFLKQEIRDLYERESKHKQTIKRYKQQIKFLRLENQVYQQRYNEIKNYINSVIERMTEMTLLNEQDNRQMFRNSSLEMVARLKQELSHYEEMKEQKRLAQQNFHNNYVNNSRNIPLSSQLISQNEILAQNDFNQQNTNTFLYNNQPDIHQIVDLQETRFIKDPKYDFAKTQNFLNLKKMKKPPMIPRRSQQCYIPPYSSHESSTPNSDSKTVDNNFKHKNFLQDTSESNCLPTINQQIEELTDQSQALMYELKKTNNQDNQIKKKIIRISQKIRELKMQTSHWEEQKFTSLQNIMPRQ